MSERDSFQALWASQHDDNFSMSIDDIRARAVKLQSAVLRRNFIEYAVGCVLILMFAAAAIASHTFLAKLGCGLIVAGVIVVLWQLHVLARAATKDDMAMTQNWSAFYRAELVRQRDALLSVWRWYLGPLIPGMVVYWVSTGVKATGTDQALWGWGMTVLGLAITAVVFWQVAAINKRAAKAVQVEIAQLDEACGGDKT